MYRYGAAAGHAPGRSVATHASAARVSQRNGAARMGSHTAERTAAVVAARREHSRQDHVGQLVLGRREDHHNHVFVHAGFCVAHRVQTNTERFRVGQAERGQGQQPEGLSAVAL